jgi:phage gpG-like protein
MKIEVKLEDEKVQKAFAEAMASASDLRPLTQQLGEVLIETTKKRFDTSTAPDGSRWEPNSPATYLRYLSAFKTSFDKDTGRITSKGRNRAMKKRPLIGEGQRWGSLSYTISYEAGASYLDIFSPKNYSAVQQFGNPNNRMFGGALAPIPARPFLGLSSEDKGLIEHHARSYLDGLF